MHFTRVQNSQAYKKNWDDNCAHEFDFWCQGDVFILYFSFISTVVEVIPKIKNDLDQSAAHNLFI